MKSARFRDVGSALGIGLVIACGGSTGPDPVLELVSLTPADGSQGIAPDADLRAVFTRPVDPQSVSASTFQVSRIDGGASPRPVPGTFSFSDEGRAVEFIPTGGLANNGQYRVAIGTAVRDLDGSRLSAAAEASFRTAAVVAVASDPGGDTFGGGDSPGLVLPDLLSLSVSQEPAELVIVLTFAGDVEPVFESPNAVLARINLDTDQDPATGAPGAVDFFRPPGSGQTGLGVERGLVVGAAGEVGVFDAITADRIGTLQAEHADRSATVCFPYALLGDDGNINLASIVGTVVEPTDFVPDEGSLMVGAPGGRLELTGSGARGSSSGWLRTWGP
ncbi:MAG: Ig-like domain-containing protein [Gemmatimonadota bacterium]